MTTKTNVYALIGVILSLIIILVSAFIFLRWPGGFIVVAAIGVVAGSFIFLKSKRLEFKILALIIFATSCFWLLYLPLMSFRRP